MRADDETGWTEERDDEENDESENEAEDDDKDEGGEGTNEVS
jgi:hypothetical protein